MENLVNLIPLFGVLGLLYMAYLYNWVSKQDAGDAKMKSISDAIAEGAMSFLKAEYRVLSIFVIIAGILLGLLSTQVETTHWFIVIAFVIGAVFSGGDFLFTTGHIKNNILKMMLFLTTPIYLLILFITIYHWNLPERIPIHMVRNSGPSILSRENLLSRLQWDCVISMHHSFL